MERSQFLARLRSRLDGSPLPNLPHPFVEVDEIPRLRHRRDLADPVTAFVESATNARATVRRVSSADELAALVDELVHKHSVERAVISADPEASLATEPLRTRSVSVAPYSIDGAAEADLGITGAAFGLAATGSIVLDSRRAGARSAGLLPPVHLALIHEQAIVTDASALLRTLPDRLAGSGGLPSQLVLATGPSRSADIEQIITIGVHGPGHVWIAVLGPSFAEPA